MSLLATLHRKAEAARSTAAGKYSRTLLSARRQRESNSTCYFETPAGRETQVAQEANAISPPCSIPSNPSSLEIRWDYALDPSRVGLPCGAHAHKVQR